MSIDEPIRLYDESLETDEDYGVLLAGLHLRRTLVRHNGTMAGIQINFSPIAPRAFFGIPAGEVAHRSYQLDVIARSMADELHERVNETSSWAARFGAIDDVLLRATREVEGPRDEVVDSWRQIALSHGGLPISLVADQVGWSRRHLNTQFNAEFGIGPKDAARVLRYDRARRMISSGDLKIADIAAICGYADQAHLNRDFKSFTGTSPTTWLRDDPVARTNQPADDVDEPALIRPRLAGVRK
ncbi:AraC family transcriptional regulator [Antricoccus suffuscus]|uniref:AraC family transcriptional regulator n=1 Tax=Antricoccus suffuscus TaxID=1629062 RepID=A0A2T1A327_9ACTN|nr:helix-turn-helix transcriptional regulator [Antricoccus suffuscus]PRZ43012.1 AraC family transcriptional regulator [Antricoccus suffuscus]